QQNRRYDNGQLCDCSFLTFKFSSPNDLIFFRNLHFFCHFLLRLCNSTSQISTLYTKSNGDVSAASFPVNECRTCNVSDSGDLPEWYFRSRLGRNENVADFFIVISICFSKTNAHVE